MKNIIWNLINSIGLVVLLRVVCFVRAHEDVRRPSFKVPNPFKSSEQQPGERTNVGHFYSIKGTQLVHSNHRAQHRTSLEEYFSLTSGVSISIHKEEGKDESDPWALIGDGPNGKSYIVRNAHEKDANKIDCQLAHSLNHAHHRQIFPWQYEFDLKIPTKQTSRKRREQINNESGVREIKRKQSRGPDDGPPPTKPSRIIRGAIYGLGAVWLNAIQRNVSSHLIGGHSDNPATNVWQMFQDDLDVELQFEKLLDGQELNQINLDASKLASIRVVRRNLIEKSHHNSSGLSTASLQSEYTIVDSFESGLKLDEVEALKLMETQLDMCRVDNSRLRLFPSLLRQMSQSAQRLFQLQYIHRQYERFPTFFGANQQPGHTGAGEFDESRHRHVYPIELTTETFSFKAETQVTNHKPLFLNADSVVHHAEFNEYTKRFTENSDPTSKNGHSTVHYHLVAEDWGWKSCKVGEMEPVDGKSIFSRPIHFHRPNGVVLSGHLTGLGALLLNVADFHYKSFGLFRQTLNVNRDLRDVNKFVPLQVDEWRVDEPHSGWTIHLYFEPPVADEDEQSRTLHNGDDISRLVRVEIRHSKGNNDESLVDQFDILRFDFELSGLDYNLVFMQSMEMCTGEEPQDGGSEADSEDYQFDDYYENAEVSDGESAASEDQKEDQAQGEHFEEGYLDEHYEFPDFFEFTDGQSAYEVSSRLEIIPSELASGESNSNEAKTKYIWLKELVDLEEEIATLNLYHSADKLKQDEPFESYFINYNSELVFHISNKNKCHFQEDVGSQWLRLFARKLFYNVIPDEISSDPINLIDGKTNQAVQIKSNKLPLYGVGALWQRSSESQFTQFLGRRKKLIVDGDNRNSFTQLLWSDENRSNMKMLYNFLWDLGDTERGSRLSARLPSERLRLDSIELLNLFGNGHQVDDYVASSFKSIRIKLLSKFKGSESRKLYAPDICADSLKEAMSTRHAHPELAHLNSKPASFFDLIGHSDAYSATYTVAHAVQMSAPYRYDDTQIYVRESYDRKANRGRIIVTRKEEPAAQVYIEGAMKKMFAYSKELNKCKLITKLRTLVDLGPTFESENDNFDLNKMYGLSALWIALAQKEATLNILKDYDKSGHKYLTRTYTLPIEDKQHEVRMAFKRTRDFSRDLGWKANDVQQRAREALTLKRISIGPMSFGGPTLHDGQLSYIRSTISVLNLSDKLEEEWKLPEVCAQLIQPAGPKIEELDDNTKRQQQADFPKILHLLSSGQRQQLHIKSEMSIKDLCHNDSTIKFYMLDEWTHSGRLRVKLTGLGAASKYKDFEFIMHPSSHEVFDVSTAYNCRRQLPNAGLNPNVESNLLAFWESNSTALINHLSQVYYGPVSLWRLAEKNLERVELLYSVELAPLPSYDYSSGRIDRPLAGVHQNDLLAKLEKEMQSETWRVSKPTAIDYGELNPWYDLKFLKRYKVEPASGSLIEWRTLESITIYDSIGEQMFKVLVEVVNYDYEEKLADQPAPTFVLPEGWGCQRSLEYKLSAHAHDDFRLVSPNEPIVDQLNYEASLEMFHSFQTNVAAAASHQMSPPIGGSYFRAFVSDSSGDSRQLSVTGHTTRIKYPNGTTLATKTVADSTKSLLYHIDRVSGHCAVSLDPRPFWVLKFPLIDENDSPNLAHEQLIYLDDELMGKLFFNTLDQGFSVVNKHWSVGEEEEGEGEAKLIVTYERQFESLKLTDTLEGPASVVRRFELTKRQMSRMRSTPGPNVVKLHDSIWVQVLMFDTLEDKRKLRAQVNIWLHQAHQVDFGQFLSETNVVQCYNDGDKDWDSGLANFLVEYPVSEEQKRLAQHQPNQIRNNFYQMLVERAGVSALQLDGKARIDFTNHDQIVRVHFNVLDAPTAYIYFVEVEESCIAASRVSMAEIRLEPTVGDCSRWCDQLNCIAMSYCESLKTCHIIRPESIASRVLNNQNDYLDWVSVSEPNKLCTYYYRPSNRAPMSLNRFIQLMEAEINSPDRHGGHVFAIKMADNNLVDPIRFTQDAQRNQFRWQHEDRDAPSVLKVVDNLNDLQAGQLECSTQAGLVFKTIQYSAKLDLTNLKQIDQREHVNYISVASQVSNEAECLQSCASYQCILMSLNKKTNLCVMVSLGAHKQTKRIHDINQLSALRELITPAGPDSSVKMLDFLERFTKFPSLMEPMEYELKLTDVSPMECALVCQYSQEKCLSFDHCSTKSTTTTTCYLQTAHLSLATFDKSKLVARSTNETNLSSCDHYSKSVLEHFVKLSDKRLTHRMMHSVASTGLSPERCAIDCLEEDDQCQAFEYCFDAHLHPAQSCRFVRKGEILNNRDNLLQAPEVDSTVGKELSKSSDCSVYVPRRVAKEAKLSQVYHSTDLLQSIQQRTLTSIPPNNFICGSLLMLACYLLMAVISGATFQLAYIKLMGRPVEIIH